MTLLDEQVLRSELRSAADAFAVSDRATEEILAAGRALDARPRPMRRLRRRSAGGHADAAVSGSAGDPVAAARGRGVGGRGVLVGALAASVLLAIALGLTLAGAPRTRAEVTATPTTAPAPRHAPRATLGAPAYSTLAPSNSLSAQPTVPALPPGAVGQPAKVEETGSVDLTVGRGSLQLVLTRLTSLAVANGGFVASTETETGGAPGAPAYGNITLRVPQGSYGTVLARAQRLGRVTALSTKGTDVTGQYVDLQARIAALEASRAQYLTILSKATSVGDILAVQSQLDSLQSQLEQLQGQLQVLDGQTTYGTLAVSVTEAGGHRPPPPTPASGIGGAWHAAVSGFAAAFDGLVRIAGPTLFVLVCLAALGVLGRLAWRGARRRTL